MDPQAAKQRGRIDYSLGRYSFWSAVFEPTSDRLIDTAGVSSGMRVLDVRRATGTRRLLLPGAEQRSSRCMSHLLK
jgi:hypothetical protein